VAYKVVVFCSRSRLGPLEILLLGQALWCFVRKEKKTPLGELVSLFRVGRKRKSKREKGKKGERSEVRTEGKCLIGRTGALYRAVKGKEMERRKEKKA
jgi:hypothetical protein